MPRIRDILPTVLAQRSGVIDQALSAALAHAEPQELADLSDAMLARGKANGVEALIDRYDRLPGPVQHRLVDQAEQFATSIRRAATRRGPVSAKNALTIIEKAASTRLAYVVGSLCRHSDAGVRNQAGRCILSLAVRASTSQDPGQPPHLDAVSAAYLTQTIEQAVVQFSRRDNTALIQALCWLMPRPLPEALAALSNPDHAAVAPTQQLLTSQPGKGERRALLLLIGVRPLADACREALADAQSSRHLADPLQLGHLIALPATRQALRRNRRPDALWPDAKQQQAMAPSASRWLPAYLDAITHDPQEQVIRLAPLAKQADTATRLAVMRRLLSLSSPAKPEHQPAADNANDTLALLTRDPEPAIARTALWHLIHRDYAGLPRILADLVNSRHPAIRKIAAKRLAPLGFDRYWQAWPKLDPKRRLAAGRALIKIDNDFHRHLANRLASRDPDIRTRALVIIATLNQGVFFEDVLLDLCQSDDPRIVASAVKALSGCTSDAAQKTLQLAIEHENTRIRANALEAMSHTQAAANLDQLLEIAGEDAQRPRANAIKALLELRAKDALPSLTRMLHDPRSAHRISALWLIDELGILQLARMVAEMSLTDEDSDVKQRAGRVIQHLIEDLEHHAADHADDHPTTGAA